LLSKAAGSRLFRHIALSTITAIPSKLLAIEVDGIGVMLVRPIVAVPITNPTDRHTVAIAIERLTRATVAATVGLTHDIFTFLPLVPHPTPDLAENLGVASTVVSVQAASPQAGCQTVIGTALWVTQSDV